MLLLLIWTVELAFSFLLPHNLSRLLSFAYCNYSIFLQRRCITFILFYLLKKFLLESCCICRNTESGTLNGSGIFSQLPFLLYIKLILSKHSKLFTISQTLSDFQVPLQMLYYVPWNGITHHHNTFLCLIKINQFIPVMFCHQILPSLVTFFFFKLHFAKSTYS